MEDEDIQLGMREMADRAVQMAKADHGITLDYTVESVERVESILASLHERHAQQPLLQEQLSQLSVRYGAYVGEVIRREWGGRWEQGHPVAGPGSFPLVSQGRRSFPINWCFKRITNGAEDNVWHKLQVIYVQGDSGGVTFYPDGRIEEH
jgi:hypothetical protein